MPANYALQIERNDSSFQNTTVTPSEFSRSFSSVGTYCLTATAHPTAGSTTHTASLASSPVCITITPPADPCTTLARLTTPVFSSAATSRARFDDRTFRADWGDVSCAGAYHFHLTGPSGFSSYGSSTASNMSLTVPTSAATGRYCLSVVAVNGGSPPDSGRANAAGNSVYGCADKAGGPAPNPCASNVRLPTPTFLAGASSRARIEDETFKADWSDVGCASEYHWHLTGPNGFSRYGSSTNSNIVFDFGYYPASRHCVSVVAIGNGRPDSGRLNASGNVDTGCAVLEGPVDPNAGRLAPPEVTHAWVTHNGTQIRFDWTSIVGRSGYHWAVHYPNGHVERGATTATSESVSVNGEYGGPICFEVRAVGGIGDSQLSNRFCKIVNDPACARPPYIQPDVYMQQALRGYDLNLDSVEAGANAHNGNDNHIVIQSIFDPVVRDKDIIIDEYGLVFKAGPKFDTLREREAFLVSLAADMDGVLGGYFAQQADFKNQGSPPVVGQVIDIDVDGQFAIDGTFVNAPVVVSHIESTCFGVQTIEYNGDEHVLHGDRRWGFETLADGPDGVYVRFYTRGISIPDRFYDLAKAGESTFWNAWIDEMVDIVEADGGEVIGGTDEADQRKVATPTRELWNQISAADRAKVKAFQINSHQREIDWLQDKIDALTVELEAAGSAQVRARIQSDINRVRGQQQEHVKEVADWQLIAG